MINAIELSSKFLLAVKMQQDTSDLVNKIGTLTTEQLTNDLETQDDRLVFWLNLYNAFFQVKVKEDPAIFKSKAKLFFGRHFLIAGKRMSLDEIEHDMLRRSTYKWSLGYIGKPFPSSFKKNFRVFHKDPRVHFAMNCGARSCPPIRFYQVQSLGADLDLTTRSFLNQEVEFDKTTNTAHVTSLFSWFRGDFGGLKGIKAFLYAHDLVPSTNIKLKFTRYDWSHAFQNYID